MNIFILDDEHIAAKNLKNKISEVIEKNSFFSNYELNVFNDFDNFFEALKANRPEIIFLDIEMPDKSGLEVAKLIQDKRSILGYKDNYPILIFSTAHDEFGFDAYKLGIFDYILKPTKVSQLENTFTKILSFFQLNTTSVEHIAVTHANLLVKIPLTDIVYFRAEMKYITIVTENREYLINDTLNNLEKKYTNMLRVHRSFLLNTAYLKKIICKDSHWYSIMSNGCSIPISRRYKSILDLNLDYRKYL